MQPLHCPSQRQLQCCHLLARAPWPAEPLHSSIGDIWHPFICVFYTVLPPIVGIIKIDTRYAMNILIIIIHTRQGAPVDKLQVKAAKTPPPVGLARSKQDPTKCGHGTLYYTAPRQPRPMKHRQQILV